MNKLNMLKSIATNIESKLFCLTFQLSHRPSSEETINCTGGTEN